MVAFSLWLDLSIEVNRHIFENKYCVEQEMWETYIKQVIVTIIMPPL